MKKHRAQRNVSLFTLVLGLVALVSTPAFQLSAQEADQSLEYHQPASKWPKGDYLIIQSKPPSTHLGPTGLWGFVSGRNIWVTKIVPGSPADGKLVPDDVIYGINGKEFPHQGGVLRMLANAITEAETQQAGGRLTLNVYRGGTYLRVPIQLTIMGSFSPTTPWNCEKSNKIVLRAEEFVRNGMRPETGLPNDEDYMYALQHDSALFIMAAGNPELQGLVRRHVGKLVKSLDAWHAGESGAFNIYDGWGIAYARMLLGEYYHRTGDPTVYPYLQSIRASIHSKSADEK